MEVAKIQNFPDGPRKGGEGPAAPSSRTSSSSSSSSGSSSGSSRSSTLHSERSEGERQRRAAARAEFKTKMDALQELRNKAKKEAEDKINAQRNKPWRLPVRTFMQDAVEEARKKAPSFVLARYDGSPTADWPYHMMRFEYECLVPFGPITLAKKQKMGQYARNITLSQWCLDDNSAALNRIIDENDQFTSFDCSKCVKLTDASMHLLSQRGIGLLKLNIGHCVKITASGLEVVASACPTLEEVDISHCVGMEDEGLVAIAQQCHELLALKIDGCVEVSDAALAAISYGCPELQTLSCVGCEGLSDVSIKAILGRCPELEKLDISGCVNVAGRCFVEVSGEESAALLVHMHDLRVLVMRNMGDLHENTLRWCAGCFSCLEEIQVPGLRRFMGDDVLHALTISCENFTKLDFSGCGELTETSIGLELVTRHAHSLEELNVARVKKLSSRAVRAVLTRCEKLVKLVVDGCPLVEEATFLASKLPPGLKHLSMNDCPGVGDGALRHLARTLGPTLEVLNVARCPRVSDKSVRLLANFCTGLVTLDLSRRVEKGLPGTYVVLSDEAVHSLFEEGGCTKLRELNLNLNTDLAGACFRQHNHTNLLTLSLRDCKSLDIMGMASCLYSFPRILNLDVTGCTMEDKLGPDQIRVLVADRPYVRLLQKDFDVGICAVEEGQNTGAVLAFRDAFVERRAAERVAVKVIAKNYQAYRVRIVHSLIRAAKTIARAYRYHVFLATNEAYKSFREYYTDLCFKRMLAILKLQTAIHRWRFRRKIRAAVRVQTAVRMHQTRVWYQSTIERRDSVVIIQALYRGYVQRTTNELRTRRLEALWDREKHLLEISDKKMAELDERAELEPDRDNREMLLKIRGEKSEVRSTLNEREVMNASVQLAHRRFGTEPLTSLDLEHAKRKLPVYGGKPSHAYQIDSDPNATHHYGESFWPEPPPRPVVGEAALSDFDPQGKGGAGPVKLAAPKRIHDPYNPPPGRVQHAHCARCAERIALVFCKECHMPMCLPCDKHEHEEKESQRDHKVHLLEYEAPPDPGEPGLVPNIVRMKFYKEEWSKIVNNVKSVAELRKIQEEKEREKEMEEEEYRARKAKEAADRESRHTHDSASRLSALYRRMKAQQHAQALREEKAAKIARESSIEVIQKRAAVQIQHVVRGFLVRHWFDKEKIVVAYGKSATQETKKRTQDRVEYYFQQKRIYLRKLAIFELLKFRKANKEVFEKSKKRCLDELEKQEALIRMLEAKEKEAVEGYERMQELVAAEQKEYGTGKAPTQLTRGSDVAKVRVLHYRYVTEVAKDGLHWIKQELRQTYRRRGFVHEVSHTTKKYLAWVQYEAQQVADLIKFVRRRRADAPDGSEHQYYREWLDDQVERVIKHRITFDMDQDYLILQETTELTSALDGASKTEGLLRDLLHVHECDAQFDREKLSLDIKRCLLDSENPEAVVALEKMKELKARQQYLREESVTALQGDLESRYREEDTNMLRICNFKGDEQGLSTEEMGNISAMLKQPRPHKKHLVMFEWIDLYRSQPWLVRQDADEEANSQIRKQKHIDLEKEREQLQVTKDQYLTELDKIAKTKEHIENMRKKLTDPEATPEERNMARNQIELKEDELEHDRPQFERQKERLDEHESEVATAEKELHDLEEETRERLAAAAHAKGEFNKYENKIDRVRTRRLKQELKQNERDLKQAEKDIAGLEGERERLEVMKTELKTLVEQSGDEFLTRSERAVIAASAAKKRAEIEALESQIEHNTVEFALDVEDMKERGEQIEFVLKSMSEREERQAQFKEQARIENQINEDVAKMREEKEKLLDQKANLALKKASRDEELEKERAKEREAKEEEEAMYAAERNAEDAIRKLGVAKLFGVQAEKKSFVEHAKGAWNHLVSDVAKKKETNKMLTAIQKHQKIRSGKVRAIRKVKVTVGKEETEAFASKQSEMKVKSLPHFTMVEKSIGTYDQIQIWYELSMDADEFITGITLASNDEDDDELYKDLSHRGFEKVSHDRMNRGRIPVPDAKATDPDFTIWCAREEKIINVIYDINVSYNDFEAESLDKDNWTKLEPNLSVFGFNEIFLWVKTTKRSTVATTESVESILQELKQTRALLKSSTDPELKRKEVRLQFKLEKAEKEEDDKRKKADSPFKYTLDFLALSEKDVLKFLTIFEQMDPERTGYITPDALFKHVQQHRTIVADGIFDLLGSLDDEGRLDFGEWVKFLCTLCMFHKEEMLRFLYKMYDPDSHGYILHKHLLEILTNLHSDRTSNHGRINRCLQNFDIRPENRMTWEEFGTMNDRFPILFFPAYQLQDTLMIHFMGTSWWDHKRRRYRELREGLQSDLVNSDQIAATENRKLSARDDRVRRMAKRTAVCRVSKNKPRVALLKALNFADKYNAMGPYYEGANFFLDRGINLG